MAKKNYVCISGGSRGIGRAVAERFAREGHPLLLIARKEDALKRTAQEISQAFGVEALTAAADVGDHSQLERALAPYLGKEFDALVCNAGLAHSSQPLSRLSFTEINDQIRTHIDGTVALTKILLEPMLKTEHGHIIFIGSALGRWSIAHSTLYATTKRALTAFVEGLRLDLAGSGLRASLVEPAAVSTDLMTSRFRSPEEAKRYFEGIELLEPADVADAVYWIFSQPQRVTVQELVLFPTQQTPGGQFHR